MSKPDRIAQLSEKLARAADARHMASQPIWAEAWESFERELLERLLKCGPEDDWSRYRLQVAIEVARHVKRVIDREGRTVAILEKEIEHLEGRKPAPIA